MVFLLSNGDNISRVLKQTNKYLQHIIDDVLLTDVAEEIKHVESGSIQNVVYDSYVPSTYIRRGYSGGVIDSRNMVATLKREGVLEVHNITPANPQFYGTTNKYLPGLIENGDGYLGYVYDHPCRGAPFMKSRPFTNETLKRLRKNRVHIKTLSAGLRKRGIRIE